jgi:hypothetical protein
MLGREVWEEINVGQPLFTLHLFPTDITTDGANKNSYYGSNAGTYMNKKTNVWVLHINREMRILGKCSLLILLNCPRHCSVALDLALDLRTIIN